MKTSWKLTEPKVQSSVPLVLSSVSHNILTGG